MYVHMVPRSYRMHIGLVRERGRERATQGQAVMAERSVNLLAILRIIRRARIISNVSCLIGRL